jgi:2-polyprenyl-3-methyl-5-hydroxy-6-metoxy-1,4-benzoquinol methylase
MFEEEYWAFEEKVRQYRLEDLRSYYEGLLKDVEEEIDTSRSRPLILDIGCGYGYLIRICIEKGYECLGIDISKCALSKVQSKSAGVVLCHAQSLLPFKSASVEIVMMIDVIEHLKEPSLALKEVERILKPRGLLCIATPNLNALARMFKGRNWYGYLDKTHVSLFTGLSLKKTLEMCNFEILKCYTPFALSVFPKSFKRVVQRSRLGGQIRLVARKAA